MLCFWWMRVLSCSPYEFCHKDLVSKASCVPCFELPGRLVSWWSWPLRHTWWHRAWVPSTAFAREAPGPHLILQGGLIPLSTLLPGTHWGLTSRAVDSTRFHLCKNADKSSWQLQKRGGRFEGPFSHRILEERWARLDRRLGGAASWASPLSDTISGKGCWNQKTHGFVDEKPVYS